MTDSRTSKKLVQSGSPLIKHPAGVQKLVDAVEAYACSGAGLVDVVAAVNALSSVEFVPRPAQVSKERAVEAIERLSRGYFGACVRNEENCGYVMGNVSVRDLVAVFNVAKEAIRVADEPVATSSNELAHVGFNGDPHGGDITDCTACRSDDHLTRFSAWLVQQMPAGTVIGNPHWWAPKILAAACVTAPEAPTEEVPVGTLEYRWEQLTKALQSRLGIDREDWKAEPVEIRILAALDRVRHAVPPPAATIDPSAALAQSANGGLSLRGESVAVQASAFAPPAVPRGLPTLFRDIRHLLGRLAECFDESEEELRDIRDMISELCAQPFCPKCGPAVMSSTWRCCKCGADMSDGLPPIAYRAAHEPAVTQAYIDTVEMLHEVEQTLIDLGWHKDRGVLQRVTQVLDAYSRNKAGTSSTGDGLLTPTPRGRLPNSLGNEHLYEPDQEWMNAPMGAPEPPPALQRLIDEGWTLTVSRRDGALANGPYVAQIDNPQPVIDETCGHCHSGRTLADALRALDEYVTAVTKSEGAS